MIVRILKKHGSLPGRIGTTIHVDPRIGNPLACRGYCVVEKHGDTKQVKRSVIKATKKPKKVSDEQDGPAESGRTKNQERDDS